MDDGSSDPALGGARDDILDTTADWFQNAAKNSGDRELLKPVEKAAQQHESFREAFRRTTGDHHLGKTKETVQQLVDADYGTVKHQASALISGARWAREDYQLKRSRGGRKIAGSAQDIASRCGEFLGAYSGVVEVVKKAGSFYGEVAYETISVLFIIMLNKSGNDTRIAELLDELTRSFPRLDVWVNLYPTPAVKKAVIQVYKNVIDFSKETTQYFTRSWRRYVMAVFVPPSIGISRTVASIHASLDEVNSQARFHLHIRSHDIHKIVENSERKIAELKQDNANLLKAIALLMTAQEEMEQHELRDALQKFETIKDICKIEYPCDETDSAQCNENLTKAFPHQPTPSKGSHIQRDYLHMTYEVLDATPEFTYWRSSPDSSLLVLSGKTSRESRSKTQYTHSWLSPATVLVFEKLREQGQPVAFYSCHVGQYASQCRMRDVLLSTIYQILSHEPKVLHLTYEQLRAISTESREGGGMNYTLPLLERMLKETLTKMTAPVTIVFDRIEWCDCDLAELMDTLVDLVTEEGMVIKTLVVFDPAGGSVNDEGYWDMKSCLKRAGRRELAMERVRARLDWNQGRAAAS